MNKHLTNRRTAGPVPARITTSNSIASRGSTGHSNDQQRGVLPAESRPPPVSVPYKPCGMRLAQKMRVVPHSERVFNACRTDRLENATGMRLAQRVRVVPRSRESIQRMPELARTVRTMAAGPAPAGPSDLRRPRISDARPHRCNRCHLATCAMGKSEETASAYSTASGRGNRKQLAHGKGQKRHQDGDQGLRVRITVTVPMSTAMILPHDQ